MRSGLYATTLVTILVGLYLTASCSTQSRLQAQETTSTPEVRYVAVVFNRGEAHLDNSSKKALRNLLYLTQFSPIPVNEIRVLAWADHEYPEKREVSVSPEDILLASKRAQTVKSFLEEGLRTNLDVDAYNMAKRPGLLSQLFESDEFEVKKAIEETGTSGTRLPDGRISYTKASKAIVIIDYLGTEHRNPN